MSRLEVIKKDNGKHYLVMIENGYRCCCVGPIPKKMSADLKNIIDDYEHNLGKLLKRMSELKEVAKAMREWIDAVPDNTELPAMPGFDRDWADEVIDNPQEGV